MNHVQCRFYDGSKGNIHQVRPGGPGYEHRGNDAWMYPRTTKDTDIEVLNPYKSRIDWAGRMSGGSNPTWGILVKGYMLEGPYAKDSFLVAHLNAATVSVGQVIPAGAVIGYEGWTGHTIPAGPGGKHTHIEHLAGTSFNYKDPSGLLGIPRVSGVDFINDYRPGATPPVPSSDIGVGDIAGFVGSRHYSNSMGTTGYAATPGPARVTAINLTAPLPYHIIHTDGTSNVYGWVAKADVKPQAARNEIIAGSAVTVRPGAKTYDGKALLSFVYAMQYMVSELKEDRAVIVYDGTVVAAMNTKDLVKAG